MTYTIRQAAAHTGLSRYQIARACEMGELEHYRPSPKTVRIRQERLNDWIRSKRRGR